MAQANISHEATEICRFCLNTDQENNMALVLSELFGEMLKPLSLELNLRVSTNPLICIHCIQKLQKAVAFKESCEMASERKFDPVVSLCPFLNSCVICCNVIRDKAKWTDKMEDGRLKKTCNQNFTPLIILEKDASKLCEICEQDFEITNEFLSTCLNTETKIDIFIKKNNLVGEVNLHKVLEFSSDSTQIPSKPVIVPKEEIDIEENEIKPILTSCQVEEQYQGTTSVSKKPLSESYLNCNSVFKKLKLPPAKCIRKPSTSNNKTLGELHTYSDRKHSKKREKKNKLNEKISKEMIYRCNNCIFETKFKASMVRHMIVHRSHSDVETFQCDKCNFITKYKASLVVHFLGHKNPSEISMFECKFCPYQSKFKRNLTNHEITHKNDSDLKMYSCLDCPFRTKFKSNLSKHYIIHKNESDITMFKCTICSYETRFKRNLKKHEIVHKNFLETKLYSCENCNFVSKFKYSLIKHNLIHKDVSEVEMHACTHCKFQTKFRYALKRHSLVHKSLSEVSQVYECQHCSYKSKLKSNLAQHCLRHRLHKNDDTLKCNVINEQTRLYEKNDNCEIYKGDSCLYQTHLHSDIISHSKTHRINSSTEE